MGEEEIEALTHCLSLLDSNNEGVNMEMRQKELGEKKQAKSTSYI